MLALGNGSFGPMADYGAAGNIEHVAVGDVDGDGDADVVASSYGTFTAQSNIPGDVTVLYNTQGRLGSAQTFKTGDHPTAGTFGDFDGDGRVDFAVTNGERHDVTVFHAEGSTFRAQGPYPVLVNPSDVVTADFNGDGRLDLAVATFSSSAVSLLLNSGGGQFARRMDYEAAYYSTKLVAADIDQSGTPDVIVVS